MAVVAYSKAIFAALILEGLRAGVWTSVERGTSSLGGPHPSQAPAPPALTAEQCPAPSLPLVQWQCPPCPECPSCPTYFGVPPADSPLVPWGHVAAAASQVLIGLAAASCNYGCARRRAQGGPGQERPDLAGALPRPPALPPAPRPGQLGILE